MTLLRKSIATLLGIGTLAVAGTAFADAFAPTTGPVLTDEEVYNAGKSSRVYQTTTGPMYFPSGWAFTVGGGYSTFADSDARDFADAGPGWDARISAGTRYAFAFELAYVGGHHSVKALGLDDDGEAHLTNNGVEAAGRWNILPDSAIQPYLTLGVGWQRYDVAEVAFNTSSVDDKDNVMVFPGSAGVAFKWRKLLFDARATYRHAVADDLFLDGTANLHVYEGTGRIGMEF